MQIPIKGPSPDFHEFSRVLKGEKKPQKVHFAEGGIDWEVMRYIIENLIGKRFPHVEAERVKQGKIKGFRQGQQVVLSTDEEERIFMERSVELWYRMVYDYFYDAQPNHYLRSMIVPKVRRAKDTVSLAKRDGYTGSRATEQGVREWVEEGRGIITSWEDLAQFPWERMKVDIEGHYEFLATTLPQGMRIIVNANLYQVVVDDFLGHEGFFYLLYDDPALVQEVFDKWGEVILHLYGDVLSHDIVGGIFHGDDLGHKTGLMVRPDLLRKIYFPWLKKYASLAHERGKAFWLHCCGNVLEVMEYLIQDVGIDAFHSFQDVIIPVGEYTKRYGTRVAALGGVDMDQLARLDEGRLRRYVQDILDECMPAGRYALGSGNGIANYIPIENYFVMLEEGLRWGK